MKLCDRYDAAVHYLNVSAINVGVCLTRQNGLFPRSGQKTQRRVEFYHGMYNVSKVAVAVQRGGIERFNNMCLLYNAQNMRDVA